MDRLWCFLIGVLLGCLCCAVDASDVVTLDEYNFESETKFSSGSDEDWFVEFYAPWCGHCKTLIPTWEKLATELKGKVNVGKVDAIENKELSQRFGVRGFPSLFMLSGGKAVKYSGKRNLEALASFATASERDGVEVTIGAGVDKVGAGKPRKSKIAAFVKMVIEDFYVAIEKQRLAFGIVCGVGVLLGYLVGRMWFVSSPTKAKKE